MRVHIWPDHIGINDQPQDLPNIDKFDDMIDLSDDVRLTEDFFGLYHALFDNMFGECEFDVNDESPSGVISTILMRLLPQRIPLTEMAIWTMAPRRIFIWLGLVHTCVERPMARPILSLQT